MGNHFRLSRASFQFLNSVVLRIYAITDTQNYLNSGNSFIHVLLFWFSGILTKPLDNILG